MLLNLKIPDKKNNIIIYILCLEKGLENHAQQICVETVL